MNTIEAAEGARAWLTKRGYLPKAEERAAGPAGDAGNRGPAGGTAEELRRQVELCQAKIDEGLARLVMVDKLSKRFSEKADLYPRGSHGETTYRKAVMLLEAVREPEIAEILRWQQDRDALKLQIGEAGE